MPGTYADAYQQFGRLSGDLAAIRLMVDTGLRELDEQEAIDYFMANSPSLTRAALWCAATSSCRASDLVQDWHDQNSELRSTAIEALGDDFDIRALRYGTRAGSLPLDLLERRIMQWIENVKAG